jgi:hypothetical protein
VIDTDTISIQIHSIKVVDIKNVLHVFGLTKNLLLMCQSLSSITYFVQLNFYTKRWTNSLTMSSNGLFIPSKH